MKVKNKLRLGFGFLFIVVLLFGAVCMYYINRISNSAKIILKDNYESLSYCREMRNILDENTLPLNSVAIKNFNTQLTKEARNLTEPGEKENVKGLMKSFRQLQDKSKQTSITDILQAQKAARRYIRQIETINMKAIVNKNEAAHTSIDQGAMFLGLAVTFTFLILFSFSFNFPGIILNPLNTLLTGIRAIGQKNYSQRIHFAKNDEFAEVANAFNDMVIRLNEWENSNLSKLMSEKLRIETIIEQMEDAIIGVNENQEILFINTAAKKILNLGAEQTIERSVTDVAQRNDLFKSIIGQDKEGKPFKVVIDGKDAHFQLQVREIWVPNLSANGIQTLNIAKTRAGNVYILKNITEFKERDEAKTNFIATISHELKTPISSIKMSLKLMKDKRIGHINTEQQQLLEHIKDDSDRLLKITSELLELSQIETGNLQLNFLSVKPEQIVDYALSSVSFQAQQKEVTLQVIKDENLPMIMVDVEKTAWVLVNLLSNALRYSAEKSKIVISIVAQDNKVIFSVRDTGKGIDEQYQKRLFDRYFQVPTDGQNKTGSGLGLAISKDFIEAQSGHIWVQSAIGEGSTFSFELPGSK
ncbi:ATP-binding protein [Mucilaginibacter litoreus]|uniref:histidine kinase n=1 Tax=Mucilaginibacter litoreus TaxID=1048221 RepID=A0ABW3ARD4_9SPHI